MKNLVIILALVCPAASGTAQTITWDWTWTGGTYSGSGIITTGDTQVLGIDGFYTGYLASDITGTLNGNPITSLAAAGDYGKGNDWDNLLVLNGDNTADVDHDGLVFNDPGINSGPIGIYSFKNEEISTAVDSAGIDYGTFVATQVVPEPATAALAGMGLAALLTFRRRQ